MIASVEKSNPTRDPASDVQRARGGVITPSQDIGQTELSLGNELLYTITVLYAHCKKKGIDEFNLPHVLLDVFAFDVVELCSDSIVGWCDGDHGVR